MENYQDTLENLEQHAELLKALAHPIRLCLIRGLLGKGQCNVSYMCDCLHLPQSTISQHLSKLRSAGVIKAERRGLEIYYSVTDKRVAHIISALYPEEG